MSPIALEQQIARAQLRIEQMRIYIAMLHPSQRAHEATLLHCAVLALDELIQQRDFRFDRKLALSTAA